MHVVKTISVFLNQVIPFPLVRWYSRSSWNLANYRLWSLVGNISSHQADILVERWFSVPMFVTHVNSSSMLRISMSLRIWLIQGTFWMKLSTSSSRLLPVFPVREPFFDDRCFDKLMEGTFLSYIRFSKLWKVTKITLNCSTICSLCQF